MSVVSPYNDNGDAGAHAVEKTDKCRRPCIKFDNDVDMLAMQCCLKYHKFVTLVTRFTYSGT